MLETFDLEIDGLTQSPRKIYVYLPKSYNENPKKRYPVFYMFDGHNLFKDEWATYGKCWGMADYCDKNDIDMIIVGADCNHIGNTRLHEYTPYPLTQSFFGPTDGLGNITGEWYVNVLKATIDKKYRTLKTRKNTAIGGSSMGGLMALYMVIHYNDVFSKAACLSSSFGICVNDLIKEIKENDLDPQTRIYMDHGSEEGRDKEGLARTFNTILTLSHECNQRGMSTYPRIIMGGNHSEASWEKQVPEFINYLFR